MGQMRILLLALSFCGGCGSQPKAAQASAGAKLSKAEQCLKTAATPREPPDDAPEQMDLSHILVRHNELKPSEATERSRAQACLIAQEAREKLLAGADWAEVHQQFSDAGSATKGSLGMVMRFELDKTFADTAFSLGESELSHVVETERGFHIIARNPD